MGDEVQQDAYDAACLALEWTKAQLADLRLRVSRLVAQTSQNEIAKARVRALLDDAPYDPHIRLVDATAEVRTVFGDKVMQEIAALVGVPPQTVDWRFEIDTPTGGKTMFNSRATADYVAAYVAALQAEVES